MDVRLVPVTLRAARRFIGEHHRHNIAPRGWRFGVGLEDAAGELVGVGVAGQPIGRAWDDGVTIEITRTCTLGTKNANSMLYGALCRAAKALGYRRVITYTLQSEPGASLLAAGFVIDGVTRDGDSWSRPRRPRYERDLFGNERRRTESKNQWVRLL